MNSSKEWHVLKILAVSLIPFIGVWLFLQFLFETFEIHLSAGFISTLLFIHAVIAIAIYGIFRALLRGKLTRSAINIRFNKSLLIALTGNIATLALLGMIFSFGNIMLLSPIFLTGILILSLQASIPADMKGRIKWQSAPMDFTSADPTDEILTDLVDIRNPNGLTNPASPLYMDRPPY